MKKLVIILAVIIAVGSVGFYFYTGKTPEITYRTAKVERGPLISSVSSTGTLAAVITVQEIGRAHV